LANPTTIKSSLNVAHSKTTFATIGGQVYGANDWDPMWVWDGVSATASDAGIPSPPQTWGPSPTASSGVADVGRHRFQYRYKDSKTEYVSNPSNIIEITTTAGNTQLSFAISSSGTANVNTSSDAKVDTIILEATNVDGSVFYEAASVPNTSGTSVAFNLSDATLSAVSLSYTDTGHVQPVFFRIVRAHKGRLWGYGRNSEEVGVATGTNGSASVTGSGTAWTVAAIGRLIHFVGDAKVYEVASVTNATTLVLTTTYTGVTHGSPTLYTIQPKDPNLLFCSDALLPESWNLLSFITTLKGMNDRATAMIPVGGSLLVCGSHSMEKLTYSSEPFLVVNNRPPDGQLHPVSHVRGAMNPQCLIEAEGKVYGYDYKGLWAWSGSKPVHISGPVDLWLNNTHPKQGYQGLPHLSWHPDESKIRLHTQSGAGFPQCGEFYEFDVRTSQWCHGTHHIAMSASSSFRSKRDGSTSVYGDVIGFIWMPDRFNACALDGVMPYDINTSGGGLVKHLVKATVKSSPSPTTTAFTINETGLDVSYTTAGADASFTGMPGAPCYSVSLGETAPVLTNNANSVTIGASAQYGVGFSGAPAVGSTVYFGYIPAFLQTGWFTLSEHWEITQPRYIHLFFEPGGIDSDSTSYMTIYPDPSSIRGELVTATAAGAFASAFSDWTTKSEDGVSFTAGDSRIIIQMDRSGTGVSGYRKIPIGSKSWRYLQIEIGMNQPSINTWFGPVFHRIEVDGYTYESPPDVR
tara:strand:- start:15527 stop:17764 length:2238 start_codon:yes stop_codon:yes gene_type:complete